MSGSDRAFYVPVVEQAPGETGGDMALVSDPTVPTRRRFTVHHRGPAPTAIGSLRVVVAAAAQIHSAVTAAEGRRRTQQALRPLERRGWRVAHHIRLPGGRHIDHLVMRPGVVYALDSRAWHGLVTVDQKGATITPEGNPGAAWTARGQHCSLPPAAAELVRVLNAATGGHQLAARAVVVVWASFPDGVAVSGGITYVAGERLGEWLSRQPGLPDASLPHAS